MPPFRHLWLFLIAFLIVHLCATTPNILSMELTPGVPVAGTFTGPPDAFVEFTFDGEAGEIASVNVTDPTTVSTIPPIVDFFIQLPDAPDEDRMALGANLEGNTDLTLPVTGTVTVRVKHFGGDTVGDSGYRAVLYWLSPREKQIAEDFPLGETVSGSLVNGDSRYFRFEAQTRDTLIFDFEDTRHDPVAPHLFFDIFGPDLTEAPWVVNQSAGIGTPVVPASGIHTLRIRNQESKADLPRDYSLALSLSPGERHFIRGDGNGDGTVNIADPSFLANFIFGIAPATPPPCAAAANANGDASTNIADVSFVANFLFGIDPATPPPAPYPGCGPNSLDVDAALGCERSGVGCD